MRALAAFGYRGEIQNTSNDPFSLPVLLPTIVYKTTRVRAGEDLVLVHVSNGLTGPQLRLRHGLRPGRARGVRLQRTGHETF